MKIELDNSPKKFTCPSCGKKRFVRYFNYETNEYLPDHFGRCDREQNCGYFLKPEKKEYRTNDTHYVPIKMAPIDYIPENLFQKSLRNYKNNRFVQWLVTLFGHNDALAIADKYLIGTSKLWHGSNIFWQVDIHKKVRTGKIMLYDNFGHRIKDKNVMWAHVKLKKGYNLKQCLFGEHLLINAPQEQIVAIVESEKTAIIASYYLPQYIWLASGGSNMLQDYKLQMLKNRKVILFPDLSDNCRESWSKIANQYGFGISKYLDHINDGSDIADHLLNNRIESFNHIHGGICSNVINEYGYPKSWDID